MNFCITPDVELFGSTVASVGTGYRNLRLLARSTASVDVNIPSTSEKKKNTSSRGGGSAKLVGSGAARLTVAHNKHAGKRIPTGSFSGDSQAAALSLGFLYRRSVAPPAGRMHRQKEERSSEFAKGRVGAWEQP